MARLVVRFGVWLSVSGEEEEEEAADEEEVAADGAEGERQGDGASPARTAFVDTSHARCKSMYTLTLLDFQPTVREIADKVYPGRMIAAESRRRRQCDEYFAASSIPVPPSTRRRMRGKLRARSDGESGAPDRCVGWPLPKRDE